MDDAESEQSARMCDGTEEKRRCGMEREMFWMHRGVGTGPETSTTIAGERETRDEREGESRYEG